MNKIDKALEKLDRILDEVSHEALSRANSRQENIQLRAKLQVEFRDTVMARAKHILTNAEWQMERANERDG